MILACPQLEESACVTRRASAQRLHPPAVEFVNMSVLVNFLQIKLVFCLLSVFVRRKWLKGHVPGAVHLSRGVIERDIEAQIPDHDAPIALQCGGGFRSALVADNLQKMGYRNVISMDGGFRAWKLQGLPLEGGKA